MTQGHTFAVLMPSVLTPKDLTTALVNQDMVGMDGIATFYVGVCCVFLFMT